MDSVRHTRKPRCFVSPRLRRQRQLGVAFLLAMLAARAGAQSADADGLQFATPEGGWVEAVALETDVDFRIQGLLAEVTVEQTYTNTSAHWIEGRYLLPLPETAAVHALELRIGERRIVGEVREKEEARAIYAAAAQEGRRAGLVEQSRANLFRTAVANIGPGETVQVRIGYWQRVEYRDGEFSISLPLTLTPRYTPSVSFPLVEAEATPDTEAPASPEPGLARAAEPIVTLDVDLVAGVALADVSSPTHAVEVKRSGDRARVRLRDGVVASDRDFELRWTPTPHQHPRSALFTEQLGTEQFAFAMLVPPTQKTESLPRELVLVIDTSGSMQGDAIDNARAALAEALARLRPGDRFNLIQFNSVTERLFEHAVPADAAHLRVASEWIGALQATNGTEMSPALTQAFAGSAPGGYVRQVVFITDAAVGSEVALLAQIERELGDARLFPVGIGSAPNGDFLRKAGQVGRGTELVVRSIDDVAKQMQRLFDKLDRPALSDLEFSWPAGAEVYPERLPDLYAGEPLLAVARLPQAGGRIQAKGWGIDGEWQDTLMLERGVAMAGVARLWARSRIDALEDTLRRGGDEALVRQAIVDLGVRHQLASRYTSLVAVEQKVERAPDSAMASLAFDNAAPAGQLALAQGSTAARAQFASAFALLLLALALFAPRTATRAVGH